MIYDGLISNSTNEIIQTASNMIKNILTKVLNTLTSLPKIGLNIAITILALYFMCTDKIYMLDQLEHHLPERWVKKLNKHVKTLAKSLGCYLKAQLILILISFIISLTGLFIFSIIGMNINYPLMAAIRNCNSRCLTNIWFRNSYGTMGNYISM